ncbi:NAD(P)-binding protein [Fomes fomentarius]|nr:NAD(P)-binding protein [Fomes fomentarius]
MSHSSTPRVWFITGTSTGLGRAFTEFLLDKGEIVIATARRPSTLDELVQKYSPDRLIVLKLDITNSEEVSTAFVQSKQAFGRIDVVVNNAGTSIALGEVESQDEEVGRTVIETNFWGTLRVTKEAIKFFRESNPPGVGGRLLQISSYFGVVGGPGPGYYVASKFALEGITESLAAELDPAWNIKITLIEPGWIPSAAMEKTKWCQPHPAYSNPDLPCNRMRAAGYAGIAWKNPRRSVELFYRVASLPKPPLHLVVGKDAIDLIENKLNGFLKEVQDYEAWSEGLEEGSA